MSITLLSWLADECRLADVIAPPTGGDAGLLDGAVALLMAPSWFRFGVVQEGTLTDPSGAPLDTTVVFEARVFNQRAELRWLRDATAPDPIGTAVLLSEDDAARPSSRFTQLPRLQTAGPSIPGQYILWGQVAADAAGPGWCTLQEQRIGSFSVPLQGQVTASAGSRLVITTCEYVGAEAHFGNMFVAEERLLGVSVTSRA
jgi:CRISPR-associated protein (TIGR03984 family)